MIIKLEPKSRQPNEVDNLSDYPNIEDLMTYVKASLNDGNSFSIVGSVDALGEVFPLYLNKLNETGHPLNVPYFTVRFKINGKAIRFVGFKDNSCMSKGDTIYLIPEDNIYNMQKQVVLTDGQYHDYETVEEKDE